MNRDAHKRIQTLQCVKTFAVVDISESVFLQKKKDRANGSVFFKRE